MSHIGKGTWCGPPAPAPLGMRFVSVQALTLPTLPTCRLPDLTTVISVDDPLPGTLLLKEVVAAGGEEQHRARLQYSQQFLSCHDPINIQFTSVGQRPPGPAPRLACSPLFTPATLAQDRRDGGPEGRCSPGASPSGPLCPGKALATSVLLTCSPPLIFSLSAQGQTHWATTG